MKDLPPNTLLKKNFDCSSLKFRDIQCVLASRRAGSSPGLNQIPYKVYKHCPQISSFLFNIFKSCMSRSFIPVQWRIASETYIPKVNPPDPSSIKDFRPIALLNVEGKLFFSLISLRLENHIIKNNGLIDKSIQKGCMEKVPGCWEHMSMVWNALKSAKSKKCSVSVVWLDIANAYGLVPHKLIVFALRRYGVPESWIKVVTAYYSGLWSKCFSSSSPSDWHRHLRGIFQGCTLSIILFLCAMNVVVEYICDGQDMSSASIKAFMDDLTLLSESSEHCFNHSTV